MANFETKKLLEDKWDRILEDFDEEKEDEIGLCLHLFKEGCERLEYRKDLYEEAANMIRSADGRRADTEELQLKLVDKIEAFHQQIYVTISNLVKLVSYIGVKGDKDQIPIRSIKKFLNHLKEEKYQYSSKIKQPVEQLLYSRDLRTKFIAHPQQHKMHNWMSYGYRNEEGRPRYTIIYYKIYGSHPVMRPTEPLNPYHPDFEPPLPKGTDFYVAPCVYHTYDAIHKVVQKVLDLDSN